MALSASLHLRQNQALVMTPQLIQSIRLLQLTHFELMQFVEQEVEKNPLLEFADDQGDNHPDRSDEGFDDPPTGAAGEDGDWAESGVTAEGESLSDRNDTSYENLFPDDSPDAGVASPDLLDNWKSMPGGNGASPAEFRDLDAFAAAAPSLRDHVAEQIAVGFVDGVDRLIAADIADGLDETGYVRDFVAQETAARLGVRRERVEAVLDELQRFDPPGIFSCSLAECLAIQLQDRNRLDPAMRVLVDHLGLLARRDFPALKRLCGVDEEDLLDMMAEIRTLDPKPGLAFHSHSAQAIRADVLVRPAATGGWHVELSDDALPRLIVNQSYQAHVSGHVSGFAGCSAADRQFLADCLQSANWLTRSLDQRARTIIKVASEIVRQQDGFLKHGVSHLRPLNLRAVADAIGMHESTVSRVTANKYMMTPRGVFELKYFFTVSIASSAGGDAHSAEAVRQKIKQMIGEETSADILSDDDIVRLLKAEGIEIARRTIAKYREALNIPSSIERRREKRALAAGAKRKAATA